MLARGGDDLAIEDKVESMRITHASQLPTTRFRSRVMSWLRRARAGVLSAGSGAGDEKPLLAACMVKVLFLILGGAAFWTDPDMHTIDEGLGNLVPEIPALAAALVAVLSVAANPADAQAHAQERDTCGEDVLKGEHKA